MKRLSTLLMLLLAITIGSQQAFSQAVTITLTPGWNWISYPNAVDMEVNEALATYAPLEGDIVKGAFSFAIYDQGRWIGGLTHFMPGRGYMYYSTRSEVTSFVFAQAASSIVATAQPTDITDVSAVVGGVVTLPEGSHVFLRGVCWGTEPNPDIDGSHTSDGSGIGAFVSILEGLDINITYHVRAYAVTDYGLAYGSDVTFTTGLVYTITAFSNPEEGGEVSGMGTYQDGTECTLIATPNEGYTFIDWTEGGSQVSTNANYSFTVTGNKTFVANFTLQATLPTVTTNGISDITQTTATGGGNVTNDGGASITARGVCWSTSHNPTVSGNHTTNGTETGSFTSNITELTPNTVYYVRAYATNSIGTAYGNEVNFTTQSVVPTGAINGLFTINADGDQVYFSQGNLQYQAENNVFRFAPHQYNSIGATNSNISITYDGWIDLFGWGTSGWDNGNVYYHPYDYNNTGNQSNGYGYGPINGTDICCDLTGEYVYSDWGMYNAIINGGNQPNQWRTLTLDEWTYLSNERQNADQKKGLATIVDVKGIILLPDNWTAPEGIVFYNATYFSSSFNVYSLSEWMLMEEAGAIFLPAGGRRNGVVLNCDGPHGDYWTSNACGGVYAYTMYFYPSHDHILTPNYLRKDTGCSVRLVKDYNP